MEVSVVDTHTHTQTHIHCGNTLKHTHMHVHSWRTDALLINSEYFPWVVRLLNDFGEGFGMAQAMSYVDPQLLTYMALEERLAQAMEVGLFDCSTD